VSGASARRILRLTPSMFCTVFILAFCAPSEQTRQTHRIDSPIGRAMVSLLVCVIVVSVTSCAADSDVGTQMAKVESLMERAKTELLATEKSLQKGGNILRRTMGSPRFMDLLQKGFDLIENTRKNTMNSPSYPLLLEAQKQLAAATTEKEKVKLGNKVRKLMDDIRLEMLAAKPEDEAGFVELARQSGDLVTGQVQEYNKDKADDEKFQPNKNMEMFKKFGQTMMQMMAAANKK
jgi:hypothetical protein